MNKTVIPVKLGGEPALEPDAGGQPRLHAVHHAVPALQRAAARARHYCRQEVSPVSLS